MANNLVKLDREREEIEHNTFSSLLKLTNNIVKRYCKTGKCPSSFGDFSLKEDAGLFLVSFHKKDPGDSSLCYVVIAFRVDHSTDTSSFMYSLFNNKCDKRYEYFVKSRRCDVLSCKYLFSGHIKEFKNTQDVKNSSFSFKDKTDCIIQSLIDLQSKTREELKRHRTK